MLISSDLYRLACESTAGRGLPPPLGWYQGQEKEDVITIDTPPPPIPRSALAEGAQRARAPPRTRLAPSDTNLAGGGPPVATEPIAVNSVAMIAGRWEGKFITAMNEGKAVMLIEHDGRYAVVVTASRTGTLTGRIELINGVLRTRRVHRTDGNVRPIWSGGDANPVAQFKSLVRIHPKQILKLDRKRLFIPVALLVSLVAC